MKKQQWNIISTFDKKTMQFVLVTDGDVVRLRLWNPTRGYWEPEPLPFGTNPPFIKAGDCQNPTHWMPCPNPPKE